MCLNQATTAAFDPNRGAIHCFYYLNRNLLPFPLHILPFSRIRSAPLSGNLWETDFCF
jgi:hypothetical protein